MTVNVHPLKDGRPGGSYVTIVAADGKTYGSGRIDLTLLDSHFSDRFVFGLRLKPDPKNEEATHDCETEVYVVSAFRSRAHSGTPNSERTMSKVKRQMLFRT